MSNSVKSSLCSISLVAAVMASGLATGADAPSTDSIDSGQLGEVVREQDQMQYRNRQQLEKRINGSGDKSVAEQNRDRNRNQGQKRSGSQSQAGGGRRSYGAGEGPASGGRGSGMSGSGRKMTGSGGGR